MIAALIRWSIGNRLLVLMATALLVLAGLWSVSRISLEPMLRARRHCPRDLRVPRVGQRPRIAIDDSQAEVTALRPMRFATL
jgi:Cu(I)/Ag(I) efflux system membrane protein CusA/SilA